MFEKCFLESLLVSNKHTSISITDDSLHQQSVLGQYIYARSFYIQNVQTYYLLLPHEKFYFI